MPRFPWHTYSQRGFGVGSPNAYDAAVEHDFVALGHTGAETPPVVFLEQFEADRFARKDGLAESREKLGEPVGIVVAKLADQAEAGDPEAAQSVKDRPLETGGRRRRGVGVDGVVVAVQPVDQRLPGNGRELDDLVRSPFRQHRKRRQGSSPAAAASVGT